MKESMFFILTKASKMPAMVLGSILALFILATAGHSTRADETTLPLAGWSITWPMPRARRWQTSESSSNRMMRRSSRFAQRVFDKCILERLQPPADPLQHTWVCPGGP